METPLFLRGPPPLSTNPPNPEQIFHDPPLCPNFKNKKSPPNFRGGGETMSSQILKKTNGTCVGGTLVENVKLADKIHKRIIGSLVPVPFDN